MGHERGWEGGDDGPQSGAPDGTGGAGVSGSILEGIDEIFAASRLGSAPKLRKSPGPANIIESMNGVVRLAGKNVKLRRNACMVLR